MLTYEYKCLGRGSVEVTDSTGTRPEYLWGVMDRDHNGIGIQPLPVEMILNALAKDGWEPVSLDFPYIFRRHLPT
jgi:hypothetical protein